MKFILALILTSLATGYGKEGCRVGEWGDWSDWTSADHDPTISSYPGHDVPLSDRLTMQEVMEIKMEEKEEVRQCRADGSCPHLNTRPSEGRIDCVDGFAGGLECRNVNQLSYVNISDLLFDGSDNEKTWANDNWGWTDPQTGDEYVIQGLSSGTSFIRITDPSNPVVVGHITTPCICFNCTCNALWRDVKVIGDYSYIVAEEIDHGIQVFDLNRLRGVVGPVIFEEDVLYDDIGGCHNIVVNPETNFIYAVGCITGNYTKCRGGLHVVDVQDPLDPQFAGCFEEDGYTHDAQCLIYRGPDANYYGREMCFNYNEDDLTIVDVTDKSDMVLVSRTSYDGYLYTHQGWLTEDESTLLLDDEMDEAGVRANDTHTKTYIWDVKDLSAPVLMNTYVAAVESIDHNQYIIGDLTYQANYMSGLRILHIDQANYNLSEVAYFDTYPGNNTANFHGAWNVYPYFASGNLAVSDSEYGLFILRPDYEAINKAVEEKSVFSERRRYREILDVTDVTSCPITAQVERENI